MRLLLPVLILLLAACASPSDQRQTAEPTASDGPEVTGEAHFPADLELPEDAVLVLRIIDERRMDDPQAAIGARRVATQGRNRVAFAVPYDSARVDHDRTYRLQAAVQSETRLLLANGDGEPVLTGGAPRHLQLELTRP